MSRAEILAPAGAMEQVMAAVRCGADAVYLGAKGFNARRNAANFDDNTLPEAVAYCHGRGAKVYVTVNTLVMDDEMRALEETADEIAAAGADAVIVQDMAVLELFRRRYPDLPRYASTQTVVHNVDSALFLQEKGYQSVVLARELTLEEMAKICEAVDCKTEAFIHGAHCMSVSGACYLSAMLGGRSGNRGLCAQPCRLDWRSGSREYALSLKDMSLIAHAKEMEAVGVDTFKIEGRMKRPEYVAAAVTACRAALDGRPYDVEQLRSVFSRSGFTDGYLTGKRDGSMFGYRTKEDVTGAEKVLGSLRTLYRAELPRVGAELSLSVTEEGSALTVSDGENVVTVRGEQPPQALNRPLDAESARKSLEKTGGTPFFVKNFSAEIAPGLMLPASALNALRREGLEQLLALRSAPRPYLAEKTEKTPVPPRVPAEKTALWARFSSPEQIPEGEEYDRILLPAGLITPELLKRWGEWLVAELPAVLFPEDEDNFGEKLAALKAAGLTDVLTDNVYGIRLAKRLGLRVHGGMGLNILNATALESYREFGLESTVLSFELGMSKARSMGGALPRGIVVYGHLPLMRWRSCPLKATVGCSKCRGQGTIRDRLGVEFPVECGGRKYSTLLNSVPLHVAERVPEGFDFLLLYFTRENREECAAVTEDFRLHRKAAFPRTGGLYFRELL